MACSVVRHNGDSPTRTNNPRSKSSMVERVVLSFSREYKRCTQRQSVTKDQGVMLSKAKNGEHNPNKMLHEQAEGHSKNDLRNKPTKAKTKFFVNRDRDCTSSSSL